MVACLLTLAALAEDGVPLALAMDVPSGDVTTAVYTGPVTAADVTDALGVIVPFTDADLVLLSSGVAGDEFPQFGTDFGI